MKTKVEAIAAHGINVFVNRQLIYNYPESLLAEKGVLVIEHADFEGVERLSLVTGGEIASTFDRPDLVKLGHCDLIEEIMIGEDKVSILIRINGKLLTTSNVLSLSSFRVLRPAKPARLSCAARQTRWLTKPNDLCMMPFPYFRRPSRRLVSSSVVAVRKCS